VTSMTMPWWVFHQEQLAAVLQPTVPGAHAPAGQPARQRGEHATQAARAACGRDEGGGVTQLSSGDLLDARGDAVISACGTYRYLLQRFWDARLESLNFVMLNPSTADASLDDPSIRRCLGFARTLGYGSLEVTNLFGLRSTDPRALRGHADPIGPENDEQIVSSAKVCHLTICAWGALGSYLGRANHVLGLLRKAGIAPHALAVTQDGQPKHPLYLKGDLQPVRIP